jgi:MerR family transcriptional regulator, heat shock protein HspR
MDDAKHPPPADDHAVYGMAVAAELTGVSPAMLRAYEARKLIAPHRTPGGTRRYSADDIADIRRITALLRDGLNLAGVEAVLALEAQNEQLRDEVGRLQDEADDHGQADPRGTL